MESISRNRFLRTLVGGVSGCLMCEGVGVLSAEPSVGRLPRWRGFNLLEKFIERERGNPPYQELDFEIMKGWGFDFARLPMSYGCWSKRNPEEWLKLDETQLVHVDQAVSWGKRYGIHINLNLHRAPGYCVNPPSEPLDLWRDQRALDAAGHHWIAIARRYKGIPNLELSFDLLNEPPDIAEPVYVRVVRYLVEAIRSVDPSRLILADGLRWGRDPVFGLVKLGVAQSTRGYDPMRVSHHRAEWVKGADGWVVPEWPLKAETGGDWNKDRLKRERIEPWLALERRGVGVHVGEWGMHNRTPHAVGLRWMRDQLGLWREAGWGWALWNLRGSFGILDSDRADVSYEAFKGHKLDRLMLELLLEH